jgi:hypothetical protein
MPTEMAVLVATVDVAADDGYGRPGQDKQLNRRRRSGGAYAGGPVALYGVPTADGLKPTVFQTLWGPMGYGTDFRAVFRKVSTLQPGLSHRNHRSVVTLPVLPICLIKGSYWTHSVDPLNAIRQA